MSNHSASSATPSQHVVSQVGTGGNGGGNGGGRDGPKWIWMNNQLEYARTGVRGQEHPHIYFRIGQLPFLIFKEEPHALLAPPRLALPLHAAARAAAAA